MDMRVVIEVVATGPAEAAGLQGSERELTVDGLHYLIGGDVMVAIDGEPILAFEDIVAYLVDTDVGQTLHLTVLREGQELTVDLILGTRPTSP